MPTCGAGTDEMSGYFLIKQMPTCGAGKDEVGGAATLAAIRLPDPAC
jgi:hypothetical protein